MKFTSVIAAAVIATASADKFEVEKTIFDMPKTFNLKHGDPNWQYKMMNDIERYMRKQMP